MDKKIHEATKIIHAGRNPKEQGWMVNPPIYQTSTIVFPTYKDFMYAERGYSNNDLVQPYELKYGRYGTQTNFALEQAISEIEGGYNTFVIFVGAHEWVTWRADIDCRIADRGDLATKY